MEDGPSLEPLTTRQGRLCKPTRSSSMGDTSSLPSLGERGPDAWNCDLVLDAAHQKTAESSLGPKQEDIIESILFKSSDFVMVHFKDMDSSYAQRDAFTDSAISAKVNGEHKEKDLEPWDGGEGATAEDLEALETDVSNGWDPNDMFRYNEENYGVVSTVPLERDNSEDYLKREARAAQLAEEIESSAQYKARAALENDDRSEEEKYTAVQRNATEREGALAAPRCSLAIALPISFLSPTSLPVSSHLSSTTGSHPYTAAHQAPLALLQGPVSPL
ncbi:hypothetical protein Chor_012912 [Crotalus horridus]